MSEAEAAFVFVHWNKLKLQRQLAADPFSHGVNTKTHIS